MQDYIFYTILYIYIYIYIYTNHKLEMRTVVLKIA